MYPFSSNSSPDQKQEPIYPIFMANFMCDGGPYDVASLDVIHATLHSHLISKLDKLKSIKFSRIKKCWSSDVELNTFEIREHILFNRQSTCAILIKQANKHL